MSMEQKRLEQVHSGDTTDPKCKTFILHGEGHTLGNLLRWLLMKNPDVAFCGYCIPHPTETKIQLSIQTTSVPAEDALKKAFEDLHALLGHTLNTFDTTLAIGS